VACCRHHAVLIDSPVYIISALSAARSLFYRHNTRVKLNCPQRYTALIGCSHRRRRVRTRHNWFVLSALWTSYDSSATMRPNEAASKDSVRMRVLDDWSDRQTDRQTDIVNKSDVLSAFIGEPHWQWVVVTAQPRPSSLITDHKSFLYTLALSLCIS